MRRSSLSTLRYRYIALGLALLTFGFVLAGCGTSTSTSNNSSAGANTTIENDEEATEAEDSDEAGDSEEEALDFQSASDTAAASSAETVAIEISVKQWEFSPAEVTVKKGDKVRLLVTSSDVDHGFFLEEFGVNETLKPGKTTTVEFTADKAGRFSFVCDVFCGEGHTGMKGTLIVE